MITDASTSKLQFDPRLTVISSLQVGGNGLGGQGQVMINVAWQVEMFPAKSRT